MLSPVINKRVYTTSTYKLCVQKCGFFSVQEFVHLDVFMKILNLPPLVLSESGVESSRNTLKPID